MKSQKGEIQIEDAYTVPVFQSLISSEVMIDLVGFPDSAYGSPHVSVFQEQVTRVDGRKYDGSYKLVQGMENTCIDTLLESS